MTNQIIADDLFAGSGGWDLAAANLNIFSRGVENAEAARATRDKACLTTIHDDVWTFEPDGLASLLIASPPCQTFSQAGSGSGRKALGDVLEVMQFVPDMTLAQLRKQGEVFGDDRTALVLTPLWYALHHDNYRMLAWEQVPTVLPVWEACADVLRAHGWNVWTGKMYSEQHGTPQTRTRAVLLASRDHEVGEPTATHSRYYPRDPARRDEGVLPCVTLNDALDIDGAFEIVSNYGTGGDPEARGVRKGSQPAATVTSKVNRNKVRFAGAGRTSVDTAGQVQRTTDAPGHTITGKGTAAWVIDNDGVRVSVSEAGVLQGFPADFPWQGNSGEQYLQAGNAVPVQMAEAALKEVLA